jgi:hypothetical protein
MQFFCAALAALFLCRAASATTVYSSTNDFGGVNINGNALSHLGDDVTLVGTDREVTNISIGTQFFPSAGETSYPNPQLTLTLYSSVGGPVIATSSASPAPYSGSPHEVMVNFPFANVTVPNSFYWAVSQDTFANGFQLLAATAPQIGSSANTVIYREQTGAWHEDPIGADTFEAVITAVPEPTTLGLLGLGAMTLVARRRRSI